MKVTIILTNIAVEHFFHMLRVFTFENRKIALDLRKFTLDLGKIALNVRLIHAHILLASRFPRF